MLIVSSLALGFMIGLVSIFVVHAIDVLRNR